MGYKPRVPITKASLDFVAKFVWSMVWTRLWPKGNDNTHQPSYASLIACLMAKFGINVGYIIATEMRDRALSDRAGSPFPCLIHVLYKRVSGFTTHYLAKMMAPKGMVNIVLIKNVKNPLMRARTRMLGGLKIFPKQPCSNPCHLRVAPPPHSQARLLTSPKVIV